MTAMDGGTRRGTVPSETGSKAIAALGTHVERRRRSLSELLGSEAWAVLGQPVTGVPPPWPVTEVGKAAIGSELRATLRALDSGEQQALVMAGQRGAWGLELWEDEETWTASSHGRPAG